MGGALATDPTGRPAKTPVKPNAAANQADAQAARANAEVGEGEIGEETIQLREGAGGSHAVRRAQQRVQQRRAISARSVRRRMLDRNARSNPRWASEMVDALRRGEENDRVDYENFDYLAAVERLRPGIETTHQRRRSPTGIGTDHGPSSARRHRRPTSSSQAPVGRDRQYRPATAGAPVDRPVERILKGPASTAQ